MSVHNSDDDSNQNLPAQDSSEDEDEVEVSATSSRMLALELDSPQDSADSIRGSTTSTAGTVGTPNTTMSISPENTSGGSGNTDSRSESIGNTPLDEHKLIEAILERQTSADSKTPTGPRPDPEGALNPENLPSGSSGSAAVSICDPKTSVPTQVLLPTEVAADLKPDHGTREAIVSGSQLKVESAKALQPTLTRSLSDVTQSIVTSEGQVLHVPSDVPQIPVSADGQLPSVESAIGSTARSSDRVECDESIISRSESCRDAESDNFDADVSNMSAIALEKRRKVFRGGKPRVKTSGKDQPPPPLVDIVADFFQPHPLVTYVDPDSRADTLDDAEALRFDSVSVRSSIPERGASVIFPPEEVSIPTPPDRSRRAISLPAASVEKVPRIPHDSRRAISEAPDDSRVDSEIPPLSASPDDVPLPSPLVSSSSSSSSSRHVSDVDLNACERVRSVEKGGSSDPVSDPSLESREVEAIMAGSQPKKGGPLPSTSQEFESSVSESSSMASCDIAQLQGLKGWMNQGNYTDERLVTNKGLTDVQDSDSSVTRPSEVAQLQALQGWVNQGRDQGEKQSGPPRVPNIPQDSDANKGRAAILSDSSSTRSSEEIQFQALKGWVNQGRGVGERRFTSENQQSPRVIADPNAERREASLVNIPESNVQIDARLLTEVEQFDKWIERADSADVQLTGRDKASTSGAVRGDLKESRDVEEKGVQTEAGSEHVVNPPVEGESKLSSKLVSRPLISESAGGQPEVSKTPKRKRQIKKEPQRQPSDEKESSDSPDQLSNMEVSPEEGLATKKYCSEFSRPVARRISRSHSTGSVKDEHKHRRNFRQWQESSTKESPGREKREVEEYSTSKKPKEDGDEDENYPNV